MMNINHKISSPKQLISTYAKILAVIIPDKFQLLTDLELDTLSEFTLLAPQYSLARFSLPAKNVVIAASPGPMTKANLNSRIYSLVDKGYVFRDEDGVLYIDRTYLKGAMMLLYKMYPQNRYLTDYEAQKLGIEFITSNQNSPTQDEKASKAQSYPISITFQGN